MKIIIILTIILGLTSCEYLESISKKAGNAVTSVLQKTQSVVDGLAKKTQIIAKEITTNTKETAKDASIEAKNITNTVLSKTYIADLQQGSELNDEQIAKLKIGMSKTQVKNLLGSADIIDPFHKNRWDYINHSRVNGKFSNKNLSLIFNDDNILTTINK